MSRPGEVRVGPAAGGAHLEVRVRPRSSRSAVIGVREGALEIRVASPPVEGKANAAARDLLAKFFGVARSRVCLTAGEKSRRKIFLIRGLHPNELLRHLDEVLKSS